RERREIGAEVRERAAPEREHGAVVGDGGLDVVHLAAALRRREEILAAGQHELHGPVESDRCERAERLVGIETDLATEAAAEIRHDDTDRWLRETEGLREAGAGAMRRLGSRPHGQAAGSVLGREAEAD